MFDQNKRRTLKMMSVTPLVSVPLFASLVSQSQANMVDNNATSHNLKTDNKSGGTQLHIQILDTTSVPDNNVILRNDSNDTLIISRFMPGHIFFNNQIMDLNEAIGSDQLVLQPGQSKAFDFEIWPVLNAGPVEYVWADHAVEILNENTSVITLGAFMADTNAIVHTNTKKTIIS